MSRKQEETIRKLLANKNTSYSEISRRAGVSYKAVQHVHYVCKTVNSLPPQKREEIRKFILAGLPDRVTVSRSQVPSKTVHAVRRFYFLHPRKLGGRRTRKCPTCGLMVSDGQQEQPKRLPRRNAKLPPIINEAGASELYRVAQDILGLDELRVISNPLFFYLARRAEKVVKKIDREHKEYFKENK